MTKMWRAVIVLACLAGLFVGCGAYVLTNLEVRTTPTKCTIDEVRLGKCR